MRPTHYRKTKSHWENSFSEQEAQHAFNRAPVQSVIRNVAYYYLKNRTYQDLTRETIPCCLRAEDRHCGAFGMDHFEPFLDYRSVEFMFRVPGKYKIRGGVAKHVLREAMHEVLPDETRTRIKEMGWNAPAHMWFAGPCRDRLYDLVHSREFRERDIYRVPELLRILKDHERSVSNHEPRENHMMFLWQLVNLELWHQNLDA